MKLAFLLVLRQDLVATYHIKNCFFPLFVKSKVKGLSTHSFLYSSAIAFIFKNIIINRVYLKSHKEL